MLNCYAPRAATPDEKRLDKDSTVINDRTAAPKQPKPTRTDGRAPYDMRQVCDVLHIITTLNYQYYFAYKCV